MPFVPQPLFPGMLLDSAARWAKDAADGYPEAAPTSHIGEMGWSAVLIPEPLGGAGGSFSDLGSIIEGLAEHAVPLPVITRCGIVPAMLNSLSGHDAARSLLKGIADGTFVVELADDLGMHSAGVLNALENASGWLITGSISSVGVTQDCTHVLVVARNQEDNQPVILMVESDVLLSHASRFATMDERDVLSCRFSDLQLPPEALLAHGTEADYAVDAGWRIAVAAIAADTVCAMGSSLSCTIAYMLERQQFGKTLSEFQALRHDVARLYIVYEVARGLLQATVDALQLPMDDARARASLDLLGLFMGQQAVKFAESVIQLHGGMGMTKEMLAARLATRMLANAMRFDDSLSHLHSLHNFRNKTNS